MTAAISRPASAPIDFTYRVDLKSEANCRDHHFVVAKRKREQRGVARALVHVRNGKALVPCVVRFTLMRQRKFDGHDNLRSSLKFVVDGIADALGVDDGDESKVLWEYAQSTGRGMLRVEIRRQG